MTTPAIERLTTGVRWEDLRLPGSSRAALASLAPRERGATLAVFSGPAGTGKTLAAEALAARLGLPAFRTDLSQVVSQYIGETEKNLARVFEAVGAVAAVLLLDEADALFGKRTGIGEAHDRYADIEIAYLLQCLEAFSGVVILATTRPAALAPLARARSSATVAIPRLLRA